MEGLSRRSMRADRAARFPLRPVRPRRLGDPRGASRPGLPARRGGRGPAARAGGLRRALLYAAAFPERAAGVVSEAAHVFNDEHTRRGVRSTVEGARRLKSLLARHHGDKTDDLFHAWHEIWLSPEFKDWDVRPALGAVSAPVLAIQGDADKYGTRAQLDAIVGGVQRGRSLLLPGCGHAPHHERRDAVLEAMTSFIAGV